MEKKAAELPKQITITLSREQWQMITQVLSKLPYDMSALTIDTIVKSIEKSLKK